MRTASAQKIFVIGIDGMDPKLTRRFVDEGKMPNTQKLIERGACRQDLVMLGAQPTVTPPMWTTMATGAYPMTHGITCFRRQSKEDLDVLEYNLDSRDCLAEPLWNVFAEAGKRTLVWHWPGSSWPPTSDSPNLHVVDGTQPAVVNMGVATVEMDMIMVASTKTEEVHYRAKAASDADVPCVITDLNVSSDTTGVIEGIAAGKPVHKVLLAAEDGENVLSEQPFDVALSPIKDASGWPDAPADAKEFTLLLAQGLLRRPGLILKNEQGIYDHVALYKSKKSADPIVVLEKNVYVPDIIDESIKNDERVMVNRAMRLLEIEPDGSRLKIWISGSMDISQNALWHPTSLNQEITQNVGYPKIIALLGGSNKQLLEDCMLASWDHALQWTADALNYCIEKDKYDVIFSQVHNVDGEGHMVIKFLKDKGRGRLTEAEYADIVEKMYIQTDQYIGQYLHLLDKGWTLMVISDHGQVCPEHDPELICDMKLDENGNELREIDWSKTKAVQVRGNHIYLNLKGRDKYGIVEPKDQYEVEEEIITALYGYHSEQTGKRIMALALRNKDAVLLGMGGPECGDILLWSAEGYNYDHCDSLSTTFGYGGTSVSPIFIGEGAGLKKGLYTDRMIRQVDLAPTIAVLGGVRMPRECEGAPVYQILSEEY